MYSSFWNLVFPFTTPRASTIASGTISFSIISQFLLFAFRGSFPVTWRDMDYESANNDTTCPQKRFGKQPSPCLYRRPRPVHLPRPIAQSASHTSLLYVEPRPKVL